jgi:hypothetical protein
MPLVNRQADLSIAIADLKTVVANCDTDLAAQDPEAFGIQRVREQAMSALGQLGFNSGEPT